MVKLYLELEQVFIKKDELEHGSLGVILDDFVDPEIPHIDCPYCSISVSVRIRECPSCEKPIPFCQICKQSFQIDDRLSGCDNCSNQFHYKHLYAYVQSMGNCPLCKSVLTLGNV